ncbi:putative RNA helicase [Helianthus debilis subsp. tardiflorus]
MEPTKIVDGSSLSMVNVGFIACTYAVSYVVYMVLIILPLYSGLTRADQGIVYVVDSGFSKPWFYNLITDIENLVVAPISKESARQRARRTGRIRPGKYYRLYTEDYFVNEMSSHGIPEMQRSNLASSVIQV